MDAHEGSFGATGNCVDNSTIDIHTREFLCSKPCQWSIRHGYECCLLGHGFVFFAAYQ